MRIYVTVDDNATDALKQIAPAAREALKQALPPLTAQITQDVRARALAHIRYFGRKPGLYLASIEGGVSDKGQKVAGWVRSGNQLAHLLEWGFTIKAMELVLNTAGDVMRFVSKGESVFAKRVMRPETKVQPYPAFGPALAARKTEIETVMQNAVAGAISKAAL